MLPGYRCHGGVGQCSRYTLDVCIHGSTTGNRTGKAAFRGLEGEEPTVVIFSRARNFQAAPGALAVLSPRIETSTRVCGSTIAVIRLPRVALRRYPV